MPKKKDDEAPATANVVDKLLGFQEEVKGAIPEYDDLVRAALVNVDNAIDNLRDTLRTRDSLDRPEPRRSDDGSARGAPGPFSTAPKHVERDEDGKRVVRT